MTLLGVLVVLLHLRRRNLDFLHTYIHVHICIYSSSEVAGILYPMGIDLNHTIYINYDFNHYV